MATPQTLPLSSTFANSIPSHPLPALLLNPITPRLASLESALLSSPPARILARLGLGPKAIVLLAVAGLARLGSKYRAQWRALLGLLGVAEGVGRTVGLLDALERGTGEEQVASHRKGKGKAKAEIPLKEEAKHVLSWWMLYAAIILAERFHPHQLPALSFPSLPLLDWRRYNNTSAATAITNLSIDLITAIRRRLLPLLARFPALALRFPQLLFPANPPHRTGPRRAYPQPRPFAAHAGAGGQLPPPLPVSFCGGEVRWEVVKLVVLWGGLRRDGFGASAIWDWLVGPVCAVAGAKAKGRRAGKVVKVVSDDDEQLEDGEVSTKQPFRLGLSTLPISGLDVSNLDSPPSPPSPHLSPFASPHSDDDSHSPRFAHHPDPDHSFASTNPKDDDDDDAPSPSPSSPAATGAGKGHGAAFPTPNHVPYKMASSRQPLRSAAGSFQGSARSADGGSVVGVGEGGRGVAGGAGRAGGMYGEEAGW